VTLPEFLDEDVAELVGFFIGDGSFDSRGIRLSFDKRKEKEISYWKSFLIRKFNLNLAHPQYGKGNDVSWCVACQSFKRWLAQFFIDSNKFIVPQQVWDSSYKVKCSFLKGLFSADGSISKQRVIELSSHNESFIKDIQLLLLDVGIISSKSSWRRNNSCFSIGTQFKLTISYKEGRDLFANNIGFSYEEKQQLLQNILSTQLFSYKRRNIIKIEGLDSERIFISKVVDKYEGEANTYDLDVPDGRSYIANGFVVHNTIGLIMDCDTTGIEPDYSLIKFKKLAGGGYFQIINQSVEIALKELKYNDTQIKEITEFVSENYTIEGAPHVSEEFYPIFDCANKCGKGNRFIDHNAHLNIMAAATPFLSGSVSKTVNMPNSATIKDVEDVYMKAWKLGIKAIALYRDGSKLSQPLMSVEEKQTVVNPKEVLQKVEDDFFMESVKNASIRNRLPNKRIGYTQKAKIAGQSLYIRTGEYDDGKLGEIFIDMHREGATVRSLLNCFSIAISLGLQHGVPLEEYVDAFVFSKFEPSGLITGHDRIKMANSIIDYIFRDLAINYLNRDDLAHDLKKDTKKELTIKAAESFVKDITDSQKKTLVKPATIFHKISDAISKGFTGDICVECQSMTMVRNGTCLKCTTCGSTTGCS
jgi:hypothetical protein